MACTKPQHLSWASRERFDYGHTQLSSNVSVLMNSHAATSTPFGVRFCRPESPLFIMFSFLTLALTLSFFFHSFIAQVYAQQGPPPYSSAQSDGVPTTQTGPIRPDRTSPATSSTITLTRPNQALPTTTGKNTTCKNVQASGSSGNPQRAEAIKDAFRYAWDAYVKYAYGDDELAPLSANGTNDRYGWGLTIVDSIDTAIIMGLEDVVERMLNFISHVDFTKATQGDPVNLFGELYLAILYVTV